MQQFGGEVPGAFASHHVPRGLSDIVRNKRIDGVRGCTLSDLSAAGHAANFELVRGYSVLISHRIINYHVRFLRMLRGILSNITCMCHRRRAGRIGRELLQDPGFASMPGG